MDPLYGTQLTDQLMANPWMLDPTQRSNQFSLYNNQRIPFPPTYNGAPTNAMGQPIQSFVDWQQANPGGVSINNTPAQPAQPPPGQWGINNAMLNSMGQNAARVTQQGGGPANGSQLSDVINMRGQNNALYGVGLGPGGSVPTQWNTAAPSAAQQGGGGQGAPPNNWQAAINALANPGNPQTMGATVPMQTGSQPAGGVNQAFLQQAGAGQGMNSNFLSALRAIQGR